MRISFAVRCLFASMLLGLPARAQIASTEDLLQRSKDLFRTGRQLVDAGNCGAGVPIIEESHRLNDWIGGRLTLAECAKSPLEAWPHLRHAERLALDSRDDRASFARTEAESLERKLALVHLDMRDVTGS